MARTKNCRSASGSGNIRKRPNGTWEGRYTAGTDERTGKSIRRSVYGKTQKEVRERLRQITNDIDTGSYVAPCSMKYSEWINIWLSEYLTGRSPLTISQYKSYAHNHIVPVLGNHRLDELSLAQIQKFINSLAQESLSAKTVKNIYGIMHRCLQQAVTLGYLRHNPSEHCSLPRSLDPGITPLETPEIMLLIHRLQELNHPDANLILVTLFTGMRQSEVIGLSWPDVDFRKGIIFVRRQLVKLPEKGQGYIFSSPKSRKSRIIKPAPTVMRILDRQREQQKHWAQPPAVHGTIPTIWCSPTRSDGILLMSPFTSGSRILSVSLVFRSAVFTISGIPSQPFRWKTATASRPYRPISDTLPHRSPWQNMLMSARRCVWKAQSKWTGLFTMCLTCDNLFGVR